MGGDGGLHPASTRAPARISRSRRYRRGVLSLITDRWETARRGPANAAAATAPPVISGVRVLVLLVVLVTVPLASPHPGLTGTRA